ncbi:hypothetical protein [Spirosoma sordidisoli]|uniref:Uncharacterized protein n=1 Tax=Spirosoma sordidisoli TaxID=2502893 RepID=A0A4Q2UM99_9BACT|nr:hypothetical protein [Spirosoma sordidisoli]RYC70747.1 hypothetical protein EQG79_00915 [Spirosoma sordidisoli]
MLSAHNLDYANAFTERIPLHDNKKHTPADIGFNAKLMLGIIAVVPTMIFEFTITKASSIALLHPVGPNGPDKTVLIGIMPVMLDRY